jgi:putative transposase
MHPKAGCRLHCTCRGGQHSLLALPWRNSDTLEADYCVDALDEAIYRLGPRDIMNGDQGWQFTSFAWTVSLPRSHIPNSLNSKDRYLYNIFIERL